jgi:nucleoside-diphosphate kinase
MSRKMLGEKSPLTNAPGNTCGSFGIAIGHNLCHGSALVESAECETNYDFPRM